MENNVAYCLLAEFDIDQGSTSVGIPFLFILTPLRLSQQYPFPTGTDEQYVLLPAFIHAHVV